MVNNKITDSFWLRPRLKNSKHKETARFRSKNSSRTKPLNIQVTTPITLKLSKETRAEWYFKLFPLFVAADLQHACRHYMTSYSFLMDLMRQQANMMPISWKIRPTNSLLKPYSVKDLHKCQLSLFSREAWSLPSFSSHFPVSSLEHQISREIPTVAFFKFFFTNFIIFEMSQKGK